MICGTLQVRSQNLEGRQGPATVNAVGRPWRPLTPFRSHPSSGLPHPAVLRAACGLMQPALEEPKRSSLHQAGLVQVHVRQGRGPGLSSSHWRPWVVHSQGKGSRPSCPGSAKWVLLMATGTVHLPWVLQGAMGSFCRELAVRSGGELPVTEGVHLEQGEHPWSWYWVITAQVGSELGAETPFWSWSPKNHKQPGWVVGSGGARSGSPFATFGSGWLCHD